MKVNVQRIADLTIISNLGTGTMTMRIEIGGDLIDVPLSPEQAAELVVQLRHGSAMLSQFPIAKSKPKVKTKTKAKPEPAPPKAKRRRDAQASAVLETRHE